MALTQQERILNYLLTMCYSYPPGHAERNYVPIGILNGNADRCLPPPTYSVSNGG
jgi:hypothetical protein